MTYGMSAREKDTETLAWRAFPEASRPYAWEWPPYVRPYLRPPQPAQAKVKVNKFAFFIIIIILS